jgi:glycosyltransferase involved in cell wall biosynthesis/peptidoglycan/xylan/chitin deacetylase (PgdA/CDA1 family)
VNLSIVIPTYNRVQLLSRTLPTVLQQTCPRDAYEVILVVDGSSDGTTEVVRQMTAPRQLHIIEQAHRGQAAARNAGITRASGDLVLFIDDDMLCDSNLIGEHIAAHRAGGDQVVIGPVYISPDSPRTLATRQTDLETRDWIARYHRGDFRYPLDAFVGANTSLRRDALLAAGGFDEQFIGAKEDVDLGFRLWKSKTTFRYCQTAITHQIYEKPTTALVHGDGRAYGRNDVKLFRKHAHLRRYSAFAHFAEANMPKQLARKMSAHLAGPFDRIAAIPCWLAERFPGNSGMERIGLWSLSARRGAAILRSAVVEAGGWQVFGQEFGASAPVLLFHNVGPKRPGIEPTLTIPSAQFERQILWLKRNGYTGIRASDWLAWLRGEKQLPRKPVVITFDDAYTDIAEHALPVLSKHGFSSTVFVVTNQIGGSNVWDQKNGSAALACMNAEQIRHWDAQGIEFGAHSRTHPDVRALNDADLANELEGSAQQLSRLLGKRAHCFAYPYGLYSEEAKQSVAKVFDLAFTCDEGINVLGTDPHLLRRVMVRPNDTLIDLLFYAHIGQTPIDHLRDVWHYFRPIRRPEGPKQTTAVSLQ